ncbi:hypothetical protein HYD83_03705 [Mycoplasmopsis bovis]|nr:hypothetical protein [Mycoplasmopsis bovis]QQH37412.1 hypothetical protein HYD83_03705 [Mycoplasmopsis bovis]
MKWTLGKKYYNRIWLKPENEAENSIPNSLWNEYLETLELVHRRTSPTNFGISWGQNHLWGKDD